MAAGLRVEEGNACERAQELYRRIKASSFKLSGGYLSPVGGDACMGCAIGAAAYAAGARGYEAGEYCRAAVSSPKVEGFPEITRDEQYQLEMGYEAWTSLATQLAVADARDPFWQLGAKLALEAGHCQSETANYARATVRARSKP